MLEYMRGVLYIVEYMRGVYGGVQWISGATRVFQSTQLSVAECSKLQRLQWIHGLQRSEVQSGVQWGFVRRLALTFQQWTKSRHAGMDASVSGRQVMAQSILFITLVILFNWDPGFKFVVREEETLSQQCLNWIPVKTSDAQRLHKTRGVMACIVMVRTTFIKQGGKKMH